MQGVNLNLNLISASLNTMESYGSTSPTSVTKYQEAQPWLAPGSKEPFPVAQKGPVAQKSPVAQMSLVRLKIAEFLKSEKMFYLYSSNLNSFLIRNTFDVFCHYQRYYDKSESMDRDSDSFELAYSIFNERIHRGELVESTVVYHIIQGFYWTAPE